MANEMLFYRPLIAQTVAAPSFVPRPWLLGEVEARLRRDSCRFLLLTGAPGAGKTALMAWLTNRKST